MYSETYYYFFIEIANKAYIKELILFYLNSIFSKLVIFYAIY